MMVVELTDREGICRRGQGRRRGDCGGCDSCDVTFLRGRDTSVVFKYGVFKVQEHGIRIRECQYVC